MRHMTYAELEQMPDDGRRYELYDGEVFVVPSPVPLHQIVAHRLGNALEAYGRQHGGLVFLAPLDVVFSESNIAQPDVLFFVRERAHLIDLRSPIRVPPDLAIEVLSPGTEAVDRGRKMRMFERFGVKEYLDRFVDAAALFDVRRAREH
jgi:Uma2 family endonuclease